MKFEKKRVKRQQFKGLSEEMCIKAKRKKTGMAATDINGKYYPMPQPPTEQVFQTPNH